MSLKNAWKHYLLWCANEHVCFRIPEIESILSMRKIPHVWVEKQTENPWLIISLPNESYVKDILNRTVMVRSCIELWAHSPSIDQVHEQLKNLSSQVTEPYFAPEKSFKITVEIFNKVISLPEKIEKIESFSYLPIEGSVRLKNPDIVFYYFEFFGLDPGRVPEKPLHYLFGRWICDSERHAVSKYSLKDRHFIGNTSMDPQLAMIMANLGQVQNGHLVVDPFVGTGSLLVAAAHFGGYVCGTDIHYQTIHGNSKPTRANQKKRLPDEDIMKNMRQYNLVHRYLDVLVGDASRPVWSSKVRFDSIITDPPYGIRESTERIGTKKTEPIPEDLLSSHFPMKLQYGLGDIYKDLLNFAAEKLVMNGRLVFWIPIIRSEYDPSLLPEHPCLQLLTNSEQILTNHSSRRLITMEKIMEPEEAENSAIIHDLQYTFRTKFFERCQDSTRQRGEQYVKQIMKRSKRGNGITEEDLTETDDQPIQ